MSAFEVKVTPTRCKNKKLTESREPTEVIMAPFSGKSIVLFEDVPVTKTAKRLLRIINPSEDDIEVSVSKSINPEHNISLEWLENSVPAQSEITLEMVWSPQMDVACKETLQFIDNRNFRKDVMVILKSKPIKQVKSVRKFPTISSGNNTHVKTLRLKSPTSAANKVVSRLTHQQHQQQQQQQQLQHQAQMQKKRLTAHDAASKRETIDKNKQQLQPHWNSSVYVANKKNQQPPVKENLQPPKATLHNHTSPLMERNVYANNKEEALATNLSPHVMDMESENLKENVSPLALTNVLNMIDELKFTPATVTLSKPNESRLDSLASLPTPMGPNAITITLTPEAHPDHHRDLKPRCLSVELLDEALSSEDIHNDIKGTTMVITNKTFDVKLSESLEISCENLNGSSGEGRPSSACSLVINKTTVISTTPVARPLEIIQEEDNSPTSLTTAPKVENQNSVETPQKGEEDLKRDIKLIGTPLRKYSESMKDLYQKSPQSIVITQGSLPNLNEMETIKSFEQNRYFIQANSRTDVKTSMQAITAVPPDNKHKSEQLNESSDQLDCSRMSLISHPDVQFNQNEILAQSSRFNLNEVGLKYRKNSPNITKCKTNNTAKRKPTPPKITKKLNSVPETHKRRSNELSFSDSQSMDSVISGSSTTSLRTNSTKSSYVTVSPPKRQRLETDSNLHKQKTPTNASASIKVKNWSQTQPKKFKLAKTLSLVKKPLTPRKVKEEPRIKLYEADLYLQPYINPDPFAATTTCDPFLASTMYLDEASVDKHQTDFKKWLNALVTMPADLDTDSNAKIDVGKLFNEVRHKDLILAPTKEEQSLNYLTNFRLESLRRAAVELFLSEEMRAPCSKVAVYVQKNALRIRSDRNLHLDVVTQRDILELLLCFNPLWLRLGLEVVYGEKIHLQSNRDIVGLSSFILNRLFRDKFLEQKYSKAYTLSEEYAEHIKKFTLQKFFFLLLFLDRAKEKRIIAHNPCLFIKKSPHKETREILLRFSSELLANIGDITRELKRLGYVLTHKQIFLDEFDYAFHNLAVDLRDGIRLTRVMEIILLREDLTKQLRVPAISRLQRIFNVNLALKALGEADFQLKGDITANDIVDGHREKTLSLLWQIIYKFRSPKFHAAARVIQKWWRNSWLKVVIQRRIRFKEEQRREAAAVVIQSLYRGFMTRRFVDKYRKERVQAALVFQKYIRCYLARKRFLKTVHCTVVIQKWLRSVILGRECRENFLQWRKSAICLQQHWRNRKQARVLREQAALAKCKYQQQRNKAATLIQASWRGYKARTQFLKIISAILVFQRKFKALQLMKQHYGDYLKLKKATICIQQRFRAKMSMKKEMANYQLIRTRVIYIQRLYRATILMRQQRKEYLNIKSKVICIQQKWRATLLARKVRVEYLAVQYYTLIVQQKFRAKKQMEIERKKYLQLQTCIINVQRRFRAKLEMRLQYTQFQRKLQAIKTIQSQFKAYKAMRYQRAKYQGTREAVLCLQEHFRGFLKMKEERKRFLQQKQAATVIQIAYRTYRLMKLQKGDYRRIKQAVICIQRRLRATLVMRAQRKEYLRQRKLIIFIQIRYKAKLLARKVRLQYHQQRNMIIALQRRFRAQQLMLKEQQQYQVIRSRIICIQTYYRSHLQRKQEQAKYQLQRSSAIKIQTWFRAVLKMRMEKQTYQRVRSSSITIQQRWRATLEAKKQRTTFLKTIQKIVYLQRLIKATLVMKMEREQYQKLKEAAIVIQKRYRARREMLQIRSQYQLIRSLIICIQRHFRAKRAMLKERNDFVLLKSTVIHLQQKFRGRQKMRIDREHFLQLKTNIVEFQAHVRGLLARRRFQALMTPEMMELLRQKKAAKIIQRFWRGYRIRKRFNNVRIKVIRKNIALLKETSNTVNSIKFKVQDAVRLLRGRFSASEALHVLMRLDRISRTVPHLLMCRSDFISTFCYGIMAQAIRSEVDKQLIMYCSRIILNLARYNSTTANTFQEGGLVTIAQMLLRWCDKDCEIFNTLCTLIWIFAHCPVKRKIIRDFMTTTDAIYMVRETKKLVARKEKMKQNVRKPSVPTSMLSSSSTTSTSIRGLSQQQQQQQQQNFSSRALPSLEPDYGVIRNKPYTFISSVYAFDTILYKLGIDIF
ncbi:Protein abnormal spindle [Lucilia cuprina]|uniref:Protein abnormal spindle n=1 Tax=Lucilia cuprina TaxID=7375 RepID=A0A0L0C5D6_LUCCU|nr:Protein abnormal spindle [Lucilia cuprina]